MQSDSYFGAKDTRRRDRYAKQKKRFKNHRARTQKERTTIRKRPTERQNVKGSRNENQRIAKETLKIIQDEMYYLDGNWISICKDLIRAKLQTKTYFENDLENIEILNEQFDTIMEIHLESTLEGCERLYKEHPDLVIGSLNFASAKNPGGGFLKGSCAQEESLALASGLYECIKNSEMYQINSENNNNCLYHHCMICSKAVPVFRNNDAELIPKYPITFLTVPAVNTGAALQKGVSVDVIDTTMRKRMDLMFSMAIANGVELLILGAWGCGVFGGDINKVAYQFYEFLNGKYKGVFKKVVFSLLDNQEVFEKIFQ